jgi:hypothetical protein
MPARTASRSSAWATTTRGTDRGRGAAHGETALLTDPSQFGRFRATAPRFDVGRVNDRCFVNDAFVGDYPGVTARVRRAPDRRS